MSMAFMFYIYYWYLYFAFIIGISVWYLDLLSDLVYDFDIPIWYSNLVFKLGI